MFEVEKETLLDRTPSQVWDVVVNFDNYDRWNPYMRPSGTLELGATIPYWFRMQPDKLKFWHMTADITALEPGARLALTVKLNWAFSIEESYIVEPASKGSRLVHRFRCTGLASRFAAGKARRNFDSILSETDRLLKRYLQKPAVKLPSKGFRRQKGGRRK